ncbi:MULTISPECIES: UDP-4-amino-4,6-dideoxy-N-acetyl-beta-L-altrosamine N-acetyltransferase [Yimella]|uniref:UDP-4-amino-4, 6-dideoxy-N-acetyl-beta-L-altrosamine N-acetyltransferase n=1 Tax=Yimella lutea TaxID=587872 RepID=A0A542EJJ8_9MICO|nr:MULTISPECIES: UDP-4-amino-4,6-dideoxy-N-acetyl-beta-L-altrosamine N-acetyltransferase [Yimella]MCG8654661.1 UDP-4-amino-4,6-dideoxy-N-acetyl-beta-L-altrosamine N-acetyltransferase [Yimella sp. NH-Cas1]RYG76974.1 UDP-4-amino-4,6-dideoxy-N-acetyl-beta-L-altrosamine N-acetyltransferase [Yimella sp. RIT 621]TQJ15518.1 UDP-4-amino-4,6-dideoxy-N-acetyl-beta-L-altrosamine N-acetyltransferase [Yimella lutea]
MLRPVTEADKELVRVWRNHPEVRAVSLTRDEISPEQHDAYWESLRDNETRKVFMYEKGGVPAGVVTFFDIDPDAKSAMWGFYLDNDGLTERGELLPAFIDIQRRAVRFAFGELGLDELNGEVMDANEAVRRMNKRNGFEEIASDERLIDGEPATVHTIRRRRQPND